MTSCGILLSRDLYANRFHLMDIFMGFCVESIDDSEMPETLLGCVQLNRPVYANAPKWKT